MRARLLLSIVLTFPAGCTGVDADAGPRLDGDGATPDAAAQLQAIGAWRDSGNPETIRDICLLLHAGPADDLVRRVAVEALYELCTGRRLESDGTPHAVRRNETVPPACRLEEF